MLDLLTNAPREVAFGPRKFLIGALKLLEIGYLDRWIREHSVRPLVKLKEELSLYPEEEHRALRKAAVLAEKNWPPEFNTAEGNAILFKDPDGRQFFLKTMFRKFQPDLADEVLTEIIAGLSEVDFGVIVQIASGEDDLDPKAAKATAVARLEMLQAAFQAAVAKQAAAEAPTGESSSTSSGPSPLT